LVGTVNGNTICIDLPLSLFGASRPIGSTLYNVTAFSGGRNNVAADVYTEGDSTRSFDFTLGANVSTGPLLSVVSRKVHGTAGTFDINLPLTGPRGVECRIRGATGTPNVDYKLVFTFSGLVTSCGTASTGSVSSGPNPNQCTVNLTGIPNAQYTTVTLTGVTVPTACPAFAGNVSGTMGLLLGDVTANGVVSNTDVAAVKVQVAAPVTASNFRDDVTVNGIISNTDVSTTKAQVGTTLPSSP
jgi:hypothetical protein